MDLNKVSDLIYYHSCGGVHSRLFFLILKHSICDILEKQSPIHFSEIAKITKLNENMCYRLLRYFVPHSLFIENENGMFSKTQCSSLFCKQQEQEDGDEDYDKITYGYTSMLYVNDIKYKLNESIPLSIENSNDSNNFNATKFAFSDKGYSSFWDIISMDDEFKSLFHNGMRESIKIDLKFITNKIDFSNFKTIVDLGGSHGLLVGKIIEKNENQIGINFDIEKVINGNEIKKFNHSRLTHFIGDFFESVPESDCYLLNRILHDWDDENCLKILKTISNSNNSNSNNIKIYIFDFIIDPNNYKKISLYYDIVMMQLCNGKERTIKEWNELIEKSDFKIDTISIDTPRNYLILSKK